MNEKSPFADQLLAAMTGPPPDAAWPGGTWAAVAGLSPAELGALLPVAHRVLADEDAPEHARRTAGEVARSRAQPSFTAATLADLYAALAAAPGPGSVRHAAGALIRCAEPWEASSLAGDAAAVVGAARVADDAVADAALAVAAVAGPEAEKELAERLREQYDGSPLRLAELDVVLATGPRERALLAEDQRFGLSLHDWPSLAVGVADTCAAPLHTELAHRVLHSAADRLAGIHAGRIPYAADKAFTTAESATLRRAARLALRRDEPWAGEMLAALLPRVACAPTAARTLPSQSACIVLAQAVEAWPTPESVAALREAHRVVRHAGVRKKLDRLLRRAERNLGRRPETAIRLPDLGFGPDGTLRAPLGEGAGYVAVVRAEDDGPALTWERPDGRAVRTLPAAARREQPARVAEARAVLGKVRAQIRTLLGGLQGGYLEGTVHRYNRWHDALVAHPVARTAARRLIWEIEHGPGDWRAVLPMAGLPDGQDPAAAVRLWHPARATAGERALWRDRITALRVRQPFRQAFREHYPGLPWDGPSSATDMFRGHLVRLEAMLGTAVREGWNIEDDELVRRAGGLTVTLTVGSRLYPGITGWAEAGEVRLYRADGSPHPPAGADPVVPSELLRSVDLLVSAGSFAWCETHAHSPEDWSVLNGLHALPLGETGRLRRDALRRILAEHLHSGRVEISDRRLHVDGYDIHLATGRVTRDGDPVPVAVPEGGQAKALPFLPYDERLLERIVRTVEQLTAG